MVMDTQSCPHNGTVFSSDKKAVGCSVVWITLTPQCWMTEPAAKDWTPSDSATRRQTKQTHCKHMGQISDYLWLELREELPINGLGIQFVEDENVKTGLWREHAEVMYSYYTSLNYTLTAGSLHNMQFIPKWIHCKTKQNISFPKEKKLLHLLTYLLHYCYSLSHKT